VIHSKKKEFLVGLIFLINLVALAFSKELVKHVALVDLIALSVPIDSIKLVDPIDPKN
jgi:hypothetical protein